MKKPIYTYVAVLTLVSIVLGAFWFLGDFEITNNKDTDLLKIETDSTNQIVDGIHVRTGLVAAEGLQEVITNCTTCHSSKLIIQNRMDKEQWNATIRWMQETQGLWDLGENQEIIVDYLTTIYPTFKKGRRAALTDIEWYSLESD